MGRIETPKVAHACLWCGKQLRGQRRTCRGECERAVQMENARRFAATGAQALEAFRQSGAPVDLAPEARDRLGKAESGKIRQAREWQREHPWPTDMGTFEREILPTLADVSAGEIARRTGLSEGYCRRIKKGLAVPHPMWWERIGARPDACRWRCVVIGCDMPISPRADAVRPTTRPCSDAAPRGDGAGGAYADRSKPIRT